MKNMKLSKIAEYLNVKTQCPDIMISGIKKDNREVSSGDLFVAIKGENFDGHNFIKSAAENGACAALVSSDVCADIPCLKVDDTVRGLGKIAAGYRGEFSLPVVGVTGSVGKTTTKEMIASVVSQKYNTLKTQGNLNNEIGLPFTVLNLSDEYQAAVIEMGMNHFGEISRLTRIAQPSIAVISTIGESHIEFLGSKEGILKAKLEILEGLPNNGVVILNGDDELLWSKKGKLPFKTIYYGIKNEEVDLFGVEKCATLSKIDFTVREIPDAEFEINVGGIHNLQNALAAIAVARELNLSTDEMHTGLNSFENTGMRQKIMEKDGVIIINDCYNANPDSMRASLSLLKQTEGRRIAVLADMLELGEISKTAHNELGSKASECADLIFVTGNMRDAVVAGAGKKACAFDSAEELSNALKKELLPGDTVLVKASRGMHLERVVERILED